MASNTLEGFHEVNLASPSSPGYPELETSEIATSELPYHPLSLVSSTPIQPTTLVAVDLPTQPIYPSSQHLSSGESRNVSNQFSMSCATSGTVYGSSKHQTSDIGNHRAEVEFLQGVLANEVQEDAEDALGQSTDSLSHLRSPFVLEVREKGYERLKEELAKAQRELKLKDEECERLSKVRDQLGQELEELTASLFEEAHKMVREANVKQAAAEKQLKEAQGKIDVLQAEVAALKTLVQSSSPTSPTKELQPNAKAHFKKGHVRNKSTSAMASSSQELNVMQPIVRDCKEVDALLFGEFKAWKEDPTIDRTCCFLDRIYKEDIYPCLTFSKSELASMILEAVEGNTLSIEPVGFQPLPVVKVSALECGGPNGWRAEIATKCALSGQTKTCKHRIKLGDSSSYYYVSPFCRYRIMSVCNFFTYIRYIQQGLVKQQDVEQMFWEVMHLRKEMSLAKLGFYKEEL
ncbi:rab-3A-interacting protein isoform X1 [Chiloscyllium plagiosum]|uniref:rab-3A-interacting protein isoform X1 n=1 Tax=Chiloscyllium plagiosum TaxID=36176 RepID=UPI001CB84664|nr:rab-3A-interacting protein isoform X1 [Chiloscyllium plagiosum]XP_043565699.1 rab-3A-interacting protein isoform X1 [Chiloscyllium plagiosum]XP_043565700.1 rab-3A-interacting protein isoform X1 [Chiloscyllium plagiosum]XP_043565701.1 rab-3A-interacting protein isoform X1 [Chiloscyllium plagiosum]XP_043565703.1 rab-3A-interacting protein isoform X1 [Chiloscyllium plagiosum]